ncbi:MAG: hypothetical protein Q4P72_01765 [Eubacteriales bacterium]|nr:hypothetical protein [Eubacteriales bacterium]
MASGVPTRKKSLGHASDRGAAGRSDTCRSLIGRRFFACFLILAILLATAPKPVPQEDYSLREELRESVPTVGFRALFPGAARLQADSRISEIEMRAHAPSQIIFRTEVENHDLFRRRISFVFYQQDIDVLGEERITRFLIEDSESEMQILSRDSLSGEQGDRVFDLSFESDSLEGLRTLTRRALHGPETDLTWQTEDENTESLERWREHFDLSAFYDPKDLKLASSGVHSNAQNSGNTASDTEAPISNKTTSALDTLRRSTETSLPESSSIQEQTIRWSDSSGPPANSWANIVAYYSFPRDYWLCCDASSQVSTMAVHDYGNLLVFGPLRGTDLSFRTQKTSLIESLLVKTELGSEADLCRRLEFEMDPDSSSQLMRQLDEILLPYDYKRIAPESSETLSTKLVYEIETTDPETFFHAGEVLFERDTGEVQLVDRDFLRKRLSYREELSLLRPMIGLPKRFTYRLIFREAFGKLHSLNSDQDETRYNGLISGRSYEVELSEDQLRNSGEQLIAAALYCNMIKMETLMQVGIAIAALLLLIILILIGRRIFIGQRRRSKRRRSLDAQALMRLVLDEEEPKIYTSMRASKSGMSLWQQNVSEGRVSHRDIAFPAKAAERHPLFKEAVHWLLEPYSTDKIRRYIFISFPKRPVRGQAYVDHIKIGRFDDEGFEARFQIQMLSEEQFLAIEFTHRFQSDETTAIHQLLRFIANDLRLPRQLASWDLEVIE